MTKKESATYQSMLDDVEAVIRDVSSPKIDLDTMVAKIEQGYELITKMRARLADTKARVEKLRNEHERESGGGAESQQKSVKDTDGDDE